MSESRDDLHARGMEARRAVLGDEHVDRAIERTTPFTEDFQDLITRYAWGEIWSRPGLDRRTRSCITLTALVAGGREHELELHVRAALRNGLEPDETYERGMEVRREVLGDEHVDRAIRSTTELTEDFQSFITRYAWGEIWSRPGLDRKTRSCITLTALIALHRDEELEMHLHAAVRNGLTPDEIREVILQSAVYCGVPAANSAFAIAQRVIDGEAVQ